MLGEDLGVLSVFAVVAEERSFTKAAVRLGVSRVSNAPPSWPRPAISRRIPNRRRRVTSRRTAVCDTAWARTAASTAGSSRSAARR